LELVRMNSLVVFFVRVVGLELEVDESESLLEVSLEVVMSLVVDRLILLVVVVVVFDCSNDCRRLSGSDLLSLLGLINIGVLSMSGLKIRFSFVSKDLFASVPRNPAVLDNLSADEGSAI